MCENNDNDDDGGGGGDGGGDRMAMQHNLGPRAGVCLTFGCRNAAAPT